jgi:rare lipoprotein A
LVRVTSLESGKSIKVRINDRGPHARGRIIDLSAEAAAALDLHHDGVGRVRLEVFASDQ